MKSKTTTAKKIKTLKTIIVIYTDKVITDSSEIGRLKKYSFNTKDNLKVNDLIQSKNYSTKIQVIKIMDKSYTYYNGATGELSNKYNATTQWEIRELIIRDDAENAVYGVLVK